MIGDDEYMKIAIKVPMILMIADGGDNKYMKIAIKVPMILMIADDGDDEYMKIVIRWYSDCRDNRGYHQSHNQWLQSWVTSIILFILSA